MTSLTALFLYFIKETCQNCRKASSLMEIFFKQNCIYIQNIFTKRNPKVNSRLQILVWNGIKEGVVSLKTITSLDFARCALLWWCVHSWCFLLRCITESDICRMFNVILIQKTKRKTLLLWQKNVFLKNQSLLIELSSPDWRECDRSVGNGSSWEVNFLIRGQWR